MAGLRSMVRAEIARDRAQREQIEQIIAPLEFMYADDDMDNNNNNNNSTSSTSTSSLSGSATLCQCQGGQFRTECDLCADRGDSSIFPSKRVRTTHSKQVFQHLHQRYSAITGSKEYA